MKVTFVLGDPEVANRRGESPVLYLRIKKGIRPV